MPAWNFTASKIFENANRFMEAYHAVLQPLCSTLQLPPMAVDILMFLANNPEHNAARDVCRYRGLKPGIVSVYVDRLVQEGLLERHTAVDDRRKVCLICTAEAQPIIARGRALQRGFAAKLLGGLDAQQIQVFQHCLSVLGDNMEEIRKNGITVGDTI